MSKHDTLAKLNPDCKIASIADLFPDLLIPMRDPFSMENVIDENGNQFALWAVDIRRLSADQLLAFAGLLASENNVETQEVIDKIHEEQAIWIKSEYVLEMFGDAENYARSLELADFFKANPKPNRQEFEAFCQQQYRDWIEGNRTPEPMPKNYEDIDPRFKSPALEEAYKKRKIDEFLADSNYK